MNGENDSTRVPGSQVTADAGVPQNEPSSTTQNEPRNRHARRGRSGTRMMDVTLSRTSGSRLEIQFDEKFEPFGPNKSKYTSFLGYLARSKVSILTDEWKSVDFGAVKDPIWDTIRLTYTVPDSQRLKDKTLSYCADRWRKFKTFLANTYIFAEVQPGKNPWDNYPFIDQQTWQQFVQLRTTPEALVSLYLI
jgi:hypothetical protein